MSQFQNSQFALKRLWDEIRAIKAQLYSVSSPSGKIRVTNLTVSGGLPEHNHTNVAGGGLPEFTPQIPSNWNANQDPGDVWDALDQLAARIKAIEIAIVTIPAFAYPANTMLLNGME